MTDTDFRDEMWRPIEENDGLLNHYEVSTHGRVRSTARPDKLLTPAINDRGFPVVTLYGKDSRTRYLRQIDQLVAKAFLQPPHWEDMKQVWHNDGVFTNLHYSNLKWETRPRVLEWNEMHRRGRPSYVTPRVKNNRTGQIYDSAYHCAIAESDTETAIIKRVERQGINSHDPNARYMYLEE